MEFWDKSLRIFKCLCDHGRQSVRRMAQQTGLSKSSVHRLQHAMERRNSHPESWLWETEDGRQWLTRLVVATLYTFGLKRGVGLDTMSEFFAAAASGDAGGVFAVRLAWGDAGVGGGTAGDGGGLGAGGVCELGRCARSLAPWMKRSWNA